MKVDAKELKNAVLKGRSRANVALYVDTSLWESFKRACEPASHGKILEQFMRGFIESAEREAPKKK